ncbi:MAG: tetratricopeptide repeat protein [Candidatus Acidiferrales bacterium]
MKSFSAVTMTAAFAGFLLCFGWPGDARAQTQGSSGGQSTTPTQKSGSETPPAAPGTQQAPPPAANPQEDADYKALHAAKADDFDTKIKLGEDFLTKYPTSKYSEPVEAELVQAYFGKHDFAKMNAAGDKALALNPDDVSVLVRLGWVAPHNSDPNDLDAERKLERAETELKHALEVINTLQKPAAMTDEAFASAKAQTTDMAHSGLGLVYFREGKFDLSATELQQTTQGLTADPTDLYVLGIDLQRLSKFTDAQQAFEKCGESAGPLQNACKQHAEQAKQQAAAKPK